MVPLSSRVFDSLPIFLYLRASFCAILPSRPTISFSLFSGQQRRILPPPFFVPDPVRFPLLVMKEHSLLPPPLTSYLSAWTTSHLGTFSYPPIIQELFSRFQTLFRLRFLMRREVPSPYPPKPLSTGGRWDPLSGVLPPQNLPTKVFF